MPRTDDRFNLIHEPWIRVLRPDCSAEEVSLTGVFENAHAYRELGGELPTQDIAVLRLLLAILHAVFARVDVQGRDAPVVSVENALDRWRDLWALGRFPADVIAAYLARWQSRFDLFDEERPFYQAPGAGNGTAYGAAKLNGELSESSNKIRLFPSRTGSEKKSVSYAEGARWLLYVNGFDDTSSKPKQKGLASPGAGWLGKLGLLTAVGNNLYETLMLNLTMLKNGDDLWGEERPVWEREKVKNAERTEIPCPDNPSELYTLQSRRLLLIRDNGGVTGYTLLGGDFFDKTNSASEQMTVWMTPSKKNELPPIVQPKRHNAARQMWRDFYAFFDKENAVRRPGIVQWLSRLRDADLLKQRHLRFRIDSVQYGDKDFFVTDILSDSLSLHADLLSEVGSLFVKRIEDEIERCDQIAAYVGYLASSLARASGASGKEDVQAQAGAAREQYYFRLDMPFRQWLYGISPEKSAMIDGICDEWRDTALRIARTLGRELVEKTGLKAFTGREQKQDGKDEARLYTAPQAYNQFLYNLGKIK